MFNKKFKSNLVRIVAYSMTMVLLGYSYFQSAAEDELVAIPEENVASTDSVYSNLWVSGCYSPNTGLYMAWAGRVCHNSVEQVVPGSVYRANISNPGIQLLIREMDANNTFLKTDNLVNGQEVTFSNNTAYIGVSIYTPGNENVSYEEYINMFENGMVAEIVPVSIPTQEQDLEASVETEVELEEVLVVESTTEETVVDETAAGETIAEETIAEETVSEEKQNDSTLDLQSVQVTDKQQQDTEKVELNNESNSVWKSGCYSAGNGKYTAWSSRICHTDYDEVVGGAEYSVFVTDALYRMVIRELDANYGFIKSDDLKSGDKVTLSSNTKYVGISIYCHGNTSITYNDYKKLLANGFDAKLEPTSAVKVETNDTVETKDAYQDSFGFEVTWRSGCYALSTGKYCSWSGRICHTDYDEVIGGTQYQALVTDADYHVLIRELDSNHAYVTSHDMKNGDKVTLSNKTKYVGLSVYNPSKSNISFADYEKMFANGFDADFIPAVKETAAVQSIDPNFSSVWRSGCYSPSDGTYGAWVGRICHTKYDELTAGAKYKANISDGKYNLLIRELDANKKMLSSSNLTNGQTVTLNAKTKYVGISIYCPSNSKITYEEYAKLFANGFSAELKFVQVENTKVEDNKGTTAPTTPVVDNSSVKPVSGVVANPTSVKDELKNIILTGDTSKHNIAKYNMTFQEVEKVWDDLKNNECYLALQTYACAYMGVVKNTSGIVTEVYINNSDPDFVNRYGRVQKICSDFVSYTKGMSDLEKVLAAHEYIVQNTKYTKTGDLRQYSGGYVLGDHIGVCQGYAYAMEMLLTQVGVKTYYISSNPMNHGWNAVKIDGTCYMIDATWDNTRRGSNGANSHRFFIRTDEEFKSLSHYSWTCYSDASLKCTSTKYSNWFVHDVYGAMYYYNGYWYYWDQPSNCIVRSTITGASRSVVVDGKGLGTLKVTGISNGVLSYTVNGNATQKSLK